MTDKTLELLLIEKERETESGSVAAFKKDMESIGNLQFLPVRLLLEKGLKTAERAVSASLTKQNPDLVFIKSEIESYDRTLNEQFVFSAIEKTADYFNGRKTPNKYIIITGSKVKLAENQMTYLKKGATHLLTTIHYNPVMVRNKVNELANEIHAYRRKKNDENHRKMHKEELEELAKKTPFAVKSYFPDKPGDDDPKYLLSGTFDRKAAEQFTKDLNKNSKEVERLMRNAQKKGYIIDFEGLTETDCTAVLFFASNQNINNPFFKKARLVGVKKIYELIPEDRHKAVNFFLKQLNPDFTP